MLDCAASPCRTATPALPAALSAGKDGDSFIGGSDRLRPARLGNGKQRNICVREREKRMRRAGQATSLRRWQNQLGGSCNAGCIVRILYHQSIYSEYCLDTQLVGSPIEVLSP